MKKIVTFLVALLSFSQLAQAEVYPNSQTQVVKKGVENAHEALAPEYERYNKDSGIQARDGLFFPPVVPHSVRGMQVSKNTNRCLDCHSPENAHVTGATVPSKTHFYDRQGQLMDKVSPRRYFCLQCHVPQTNAPAIVGQNYQANADYQNSKEALPPVTKTPKFEGQFKQTLEDFKHSSDPYLNKEQH